MDNTRNKFIDGDELSESTSLTYLLNCEDNTHQLCPGYEGQLMSDGGAYSPFHSILLVLTHDFIITCVYGPTGSDGHDKRRGRCVAHYFCAV